MHTGLFEQVTIRTGLFVGLLLTLAACSSTSSTRSTATSAVTNPNAGRYSIQQDRAPTRQMDIASIPEVIPEPVVRTMAGNRSPYSVLGQTYYVLPSEEGYRANGVASWYGEKFHGHRTSNGEIFDMYLASAAHKSLPIPSFLRVTNLDNNRSIIVRVNDRGPFHGDRLIDLSYAAAVKLGYADRGTARVQLEAVLPDATLERPDLRIASAAPRTIASSNSQYLQVGAFSELTSARNLIAQLQELTPHPVFIRTIQTDANAVLHRVRIGPLQDAGEIRRLTQSVVAANLGSPYTVTE